MNGDSTITSDYILPEIYSGERNKKGIFIKCYDKGRKWDGVILASDQGFSFDDEEYSHHDFYDNETILSLNLTTMRVDIIALEDLDYWEIYTYDITQEEYDIYQEYYVQIMHRIKTTAVYGEVTEDEGYLVEQGLSGYFFILQWCDWNCTQSIDAFAETLATVKELPKDIILLPFEIKDDEIVCGDNLIHLKDCEGKLGLRIQGENLPKTFYQENVINRYKEYMREKQ